MQQTKPKTIACKHNFSIFVLVMKQHLTLILFFLIPLIAFPQGISSREITKLPHFERVRLASGINLTIIKGDKPKVTIKGERTVISQVVCQVTEGEMAIFTTRFRYKKSKKIDIIMEVDSAITEIYGTSGNKVRCEVPLPCQDLVLNARYGCDFFINVKAEYVKAKAYTGSDIRLVGTATKAEMFAENASTIRAFNLSTQRNFVAASVSSSVDVRVSDVINVSSTDDCIVRYKGTPSSQQINAIGDSKVYAVDDDAI